LSGPVVCLNLPPPPDHSGWSHRHDLHSRLKTDRQHFVFSRTGCQGRLLRCYAGITNKTGIAVRVKFDFCMPRKKYPANVVGPQIRKARGRLGLTQEQLAAHCQLAGLDISRSSLGQIEARLRYVTDEELIVLASLLGVTTEQLYPEELLKRYRGKKISPKTPV